MKRTFSLFVFILFFSFNLFCQDNNPEESWTPELGFTKQFFQSSFKGYDVRIISPRFAIETENDSWSDDQEKNPELYKKGRFFFEANYAPPYLDSEYTTKVSEFSLASDFTYSLLLKKRFSINAIAGLKFFFVTAKNYGLVNFGKVYYWDLGLSAQMNLGFVSPFVEIKRGAYYTMGAEFNFHPVYRKPKKKYKAHRNLSR